MMESHAVLYFCSLLIVLFLESGGTGLGSLLSG